MKYSYIQNWDQVFKKFCFSTFIFLYLDITKLQYCAQEHTQTHSDMCVVYVCVTSDLISHPSIPFQSL